MTAKCLVAGWLVAVHCGAVLGAPLRVVAAENFYGDVARQVGGARVAVTDILSDPSQDPHYFEATPSVARALADAQLVIHNGAGYDPWVTRLIGGGSGARRVINVADLVGVVAGANPHIWYDPQAMIRLAEALAASFKAHDPTNAGEYDERLARFLDDMQALEQQIGDMRSRYHGLAVTATEPVFGYMAAALGLEMRNQEFQLAMMNDTEPTPSQVAAFESDLRGRKVSALLYNSQVTDTTTRHFRELARSASIPIVGIAETQPEGASYQNWMRDQLQLLARALDQARKSTRQ